MAGPSRRLAAPLFVVSVSGWLLATVSDYLQWRLPATWMLHVTVVVVIVTVALALAARVWRDDDAGCDRAD